MTASVSFGGVAGFDLLGVPSNSTILRSLNTASLYLHATAVQVAYDDGTLARIATLFRSAPPADAELGFQTGSRAISLFQGWVKRVVLQSGFRLDTASVNGFNPGATSLVAWDDYVDLARSVGIATVSPVFSPNSSGWPLDWSSSIYAGLRAAALYGGGLTIDAPPAFFAARSTAYQAFIKQEIAWANAKQLRTTVIVSPFGPAAGFAHDAAGFVQTLAAAGTLPTHWVIENYQLNVPATAPDQIGAETVAGSVNGVALWIAETTQTRLPSPVPAISMIANPAVSASASYPQLVTLPNERHVVAMPATNAGVISLGDDTINGGAGSDTVWAGAGSVSVHGGTGSMTFHGGSGVANISLQRGTSDRITLGSGGGVVFMGGADSIVGGSGSGIFQFTHGIVAHAVISGFAPGNDEITLANYGAGTAAALLAGARDSAAGTVLTFGDGTIVTLAGLHQINSSLFG